MQNHIDQNIEPFLKKERRHTDDSLTAERSKTDDSLSGHKREAESKTDETVSSDRKQIDRKRAKIRNDHDFSKVPDPALLNQRLADDKVVQSERAKVDAAIQTERAQRDKVLSAFLERERQETDQSLLNERGQTDKAVQKSSQLLTDEIGSHARTQAELTTRDELLAIVSHDLRNPIGSVLSCADMLLTDPEYGEMSSELNHWIKLIKRNAETSLRLISDILDMERIAEGKLELRLKKQSLSKTMREAVEPFVHLASANRILLKISPPTEDVLALFDRDRIAQVLSNLVGNALKFTPEMGSVTLSARKEAEKTIVAIRDTGIGIPDEEKERIFNRYTQIGKKDRRGLGLGLYISKTLIEAHGGRLWVVSAPDKGSIFQFSLPN